MPIAKGAKSQIVWKEESVFGTAPAGNYNQLPINSETLDENINTLTGEDLRVDRATPSIRGGNIATGGNVIHDFGLVRELTWLRHMMAAGASAAGSTLTVPTLAASTLYKRGDYVKVTNGDTYVCTQGGTTDAAITATSLTHQSGRATIAGTASTLVEFEYVGATGTAIYTHTLTAGIDFPTGGLTIEKQINGVTVPLFIQHRGCRINTLDLAVQQEGITKATWGLLSKQAYASNSTGGGTPTILNEDPANGFSAFIHLNDANGATLRSYKEFNMQFTNNVAEDVYVIGKRYREELPEGTRKISGNLTLYFVDRSEYDIFKNESKFALKLSFVQGGEYLEFDLPEVKITGPGSPKISGQGVIQTQFEWTAFKQSSGYDFRVIGRNKTQNLPV